jgi:hypothetical protein
MKTITVPARARTLNDLLNKARRKQIILESADGQRFVLALLKDWDGFAVGADDDITKNKELMRRLSHRKSLGKRIPLAQVRSQLGLA